MAKKDIKQKKVVSGKMDPVVHFEIPIADKKRTAKFYAAAFNWKTKMLGEENSNYMIAYTSKTGKSGRPKEKGIINGGFYPKGNSKITQYPSVVVSVKNIKTSMKKIIKAGGRIIGEPVKIPGLGKYVSFYDTENNRVSILEPLAG